MGKKPVKKVAKKPVARKPVKKVVKKVAPKKVVKKVAPKKVVKKTVARKPVKKTGFQTNVGASAQSFSSKIISKENWAVQAVGLLGNLGKSKKTFRDVM